MENYILFIHIIIAMLIIGLVLIQHGKGADVGASFGSGASNTIFGSKGSGSFLAKATMVLAILFAISSISFTKYVAAANKSDVIEVDALEKDTTSSAEDIIKHPLITQTNASNKSEEIFKDPLFNPVNESTNSDKTEQIKPKKKKLAEK